MKKSAMVPEVDRKAFESTMTLEEAVCIHNQAHACLMRGDSDSAFAILGKLPLPPWEAMDFLLDPAYGKEYLLSGFNLADAEKAYGKDWLEKFGPKHHTKHRNRVVWKNLDEACGRER